ncbi:collagen alpha-6(VI) chain [Gracilaria domingensis]|nr:collagen alpha-6(VI) chain [Gracilaria domingensis]
MPHEEARLMYKQTVRIATEEVERRGCSVNLCFAVDTSGSVNQTEFNLEKEFLMDISAIVGSDSRSKLAAGQYGARTYRISSLTSDPEVFNLRVRNAVFQHDPYTSVGSGIVYCDRVLRREARTNPDANHANKMVVLGDGRNNLGGDPIRRANTFRERAGGVVSTVGVGFQDRSALADIAGSEDRVFAINDYVELSFVLDDLVFDICGIELNIDG